MSTIDYQNNAQERVKLALAEPSAAEALTIAQIATAEATLALVEQQRIANVIALRKTEERYWVEPDEETGDPGYYSYRLRADIREGLGLS